VAEQPVREADVLCGTGACESCQSRKGQPDRNAEKNPVASEPPPPCGYFRKYEGRPTHGTCARSGNDEDFPFLDMKNGTGMCGGCRSRTVCAEVVNLRIERQVTITLGEDGLGRRGKRKPDKREGDTLLPDDILTLQEVAEKQKKLCEDARWFAEQLEQPASSLFPEAKGSPASVKEYLASMIAGDSVYALAASRRLKIESQRTIPPQTITDMVTHPREHIRGVTIDKTATGIVGQDPTSKKKTNWRQPASSFGESFMQAGFLRPEESEELLSYALRVQSQDRRPPNWACAFASIIGAKPTAVRAACNRKVK